MSCFLVTVMVQPSNAANQSSVHYTITEDVFAQGGGYAAAGVYEVNSTAGQQGTIGNQAGILYENQSGFWHTLLSLSTIPTLSGMLVLFCLTVFGFFMYLNTRTGGGVTMKSLFKMSIILMFAIVFLWTGQVYAVPGMINYQGKISVGGTPFTGTGYFQFAIVDGTGTITHWTNDGNKPITTDVTVPVINGLYNVILGETDGMLPVPASIFSNDGLYLRIWFDDGVNGLEQLVPDQRLTSTGYSFMSVNAGDADTVDGYHGATLEESAEIDTDIATHAALSDAHHTKTTSFSDLTDQATDTQIPNDITINYAAYAGDADTVDGKHASELDQSPEIAALEARVAALEGLLQYVTRSGQDYTLQGNLHVVNGTSSTDGPPNSLGNVIIGYNESRGSGDNRTGSHMLVVGKANNYSTFGGIVVGENNETNSAYSTVSGGFDNTASGAWSSISGGLANNTIGNCSTVSSGVGNTASGFTSTVSGGINNTASGDWSSISGGYLNTASGTNSSVSGGTGNIASGFDSSISGGSGNTTSGDCVLHQWRVW